MWCWVSVCVNKYFYYVYNIYYLVEVFYLWVQNSHGLAVITVVITVVITERINGRVTHLNRLVIDLLYCQNAVVGAFWGPGRHSRFVRV